MKPIYLFLFILILSQACELELTPTDRVVANDLQSAPGGLASATYGNYAMLKDILLYNGVEDLRNTYVRHLYQMGEFSGDNVMISGSTTDPLFQAFTLKHNPALMSSSYFWFVAYKIINGANLIIESAEEGNNDRDDQIIGENYFLRAMAHFDLLRFFARPPSQGTDNPGIILRTSTSTETDVSRATVGASYNQVVEDLLAGAALMNQPHGPEYASKEAAWALLSRVYLYMKNNEKAAEFATKVIDANKYTLEPRANYVASFWNTPTSTESIFIMKLLPQDDKGSGSIGSMYLGEGPGWGEIYPSQSFRQLLAQHPEDVRNDLIKPELDENGNIALRNGYPKYYITKFSYQDDIVTLSSPQYLRFSEMYLNRAEANAKLGNDQQALDDVNLLRERAGLTGNALYTTANTGSRSVLDVVLEERRIELAYEAQRPFDVYRNKRNMDRSYPGGHLAGGETTQIIEYTNPRTIFYIPQDETDLNNAIQQNP